MNNIIKRVWNQNRMTNIEDLSGMAFQAESGGHTFEIAGIDDNDNAVALSGTVSGVFIRPDNADVALVGSISDGIASVTLTDACYAVAGRFALTVFVTDGQGRKVGVYACIGTVSRSSGGAVAGETTADVVDLINAINAAVASIPASYTDLMAAIAPTYSDTNTYEVGARVWYSGKLYRCTTAISTPESWTPSHWATSVLSTWISYLEAQIQSISGGNGDFYIVPLSNGAIPTPYQGVTTTANMSASDLLAIMQSSLLCVTVTFDGDQIALYENYRDADGIYLRSHDDVGGYVYTATIDTPVSGSSTTVTIGRTLDKTPRNAYIENGVITFVNSIESDLFSIGLPIYSGGVS